MVDDNAYVVRSTRRDNAGRSLYTVVDMNGAVIHVTMPYNHATDHEADIVIRAALASRHPKHKPVM